MKRSPRPALVGPRTYLPIPVVARGKRIRLHLHFDEDGGFWVDSPDMRGLVTQGEDTEEAIANGVDAALALMEAEVLLRRKGSR